MAVAFTAQPIQWPISQQSRSNFGPILKYTLLKKYFLRRFATVFRHAAMVRCESHRAEERIALRSLQGQRHHGAGRGSRRKGRQHVEALSDACAINPQRAPPRPAQALPLRACLECTQPVQAAPRRPSRRVLYGLCGLCSSAAAPPPKRELLARPSAARPARPAPFMPLACRSRAACSSLSEMAWQAHAQNSARQAASFCSLSGPNLSHSRPRGANATGACCKDVSTLGPPRKPYSPCKRMGDTPFLEDREC